MVMHRFAFLGPFADLKWQIFVPFHILQLVVKSLWLPHIGHYSEYRPLPRYFTDVIIIVKIVEYNHHLVVPAQLKSRLVDENKLMDDAESNMK